MSAHTVFAGCLAVSLGAIALMGFQHLRMGGVRPYAAFASLLAALILFAFIRIDDGKGYARSRSKIRAPGARHHFLLWESIVLVLLVAANVLLGILFLLG